MCFKVSWHDRIPAGVQKFSSHRKRLVAGWVWLRCQKEMERKINGLFERSTFLWSPPPSPSGRYSLMYRWSPRTGRQIFFFEPLCWLVWPGLACPVEWDSDWWGGKETADCCWLPFSNIFPYSWSCLQSIPLNNEDIRSKALIFSAKYLLHQNVHICNYVKMSAIR